MQISWLVRMLSATLLDPRRFLRGSRLTIQPAEGLELELLFDVRQLVTRVVRNQGVFEEWLTKLFVTNMKAGQSAIDIGANVGYFTLLFALLSRPGGQVIAVEPLFTTDLDANLDLNRATLAGSSIKVVRAVVAERSGSRVIYRPRDRDLASSSLTPHSHRDLQSVVPCWTLDEVAANVDQLDWIKMDVEGAEGLVLEGGLETIARFRPNLVLAWCPDSMKRLGTTEDALGALLIHLGYRLFCSETNMKELCLPTTRGREHTVVATTDPGSVRLPPWPAGSSDPR